MALAGGGIGLLVGLSGDSTSRPIPPAGRGGGVSTAGGTAGSATAASATAASATAAGDTPAVVQARQVVVRYLDDINQLDRAAAQLLICPPLVDGWKTSIDQPGGDFTLAIDQATFQRATVRGGGLDLAYALEVTDRTTGALNTNEVTFTVLADAAGNLQLCGER